MSDELDPRYVKGNPLPKSIGRCADMYAEVRELRLAMQKVVDEVQEREREIREHIIANLSKSEDTGAAGKRYRAQIVKKVVPQVADWPALWAHILKTKRFDLLQKRVAERAVKDVWEEGSSVPGVEKFNAIEVSITKI
jgi:hypothetical protein